jgi:hypothetical protein
MSRGKRKSFVIDSVEFSPVEVLAGLAMLKCLSSGEWSLEELCTFLNSNGNGRRTELKFAPFLRRGLREREQLLESVRRQLAA